MQTVEENYQLVNGHIMREFDKELCHFRKFLDLVPRVINMQSADTRVSCHGTTSEGAPKWNKKVVILYLRMCMLLQERSRREAVTSSLTRNWIFSKSWEFWREFFGNFWDFFENFVGIFGKFIRNLLRILWEFFGKLF